MKHPNLKYIAEVLTLALSGALAIGCNETTTPKPAPTNVRVQKPIVEPDQLNRDNTGVNVRDRDHATKTPIDQNENQADIQTTADIRKRVVGTELSTAAHNVKIITQDGNVTLRGPVKSAEEKETIGKIATEIAGAGKVDNQLEIESQE